MSEDTQQLLSFQEASAADMPRRVCVGTVGEVGEPHPSKNEKNPGRYIVQPISIDPMGSGTAITVYFLYRPEWLQPGFNPRSIADQFDDSPEGKKDAEGVLSVYRSNIAGKGSISTLRGLCGSEEAFTKLAHRLLSLEDTSNMEAVADVLRTFFSEDNQGVMIGYVLQQQSTKTDEVDPDTGKNVYVKENRYQIARKNGWFEYSEKAIERYKKAAEKSQGRMLVTYDGEPF